MTVVVITLAVALVASMGVIVWLVRLNNSRIDQLLNVEGFLTSALKEGMEKTLIAERALFEKEKSVSALTDEQARSDALEDFISANAQETDPNADLAPDDVFGRVLRFSQKTKRPRALPDPSGKTDPNTNAPVRPEEGTVISGTIGLPRP